MSKIVPLQKKEVAEAKGIAEQYRKATEKATGVMQIWHTEEKKQEHLKYVAENVQAGIIPF